MSMGPNQLTKRLNEQTELIRILKRHMSNVEERLGFLETKLDTQLGATQAGNGTRNMIAILVAVKFLLDGAGHIDWTSVEHLLKLFTN